VTNRFQFGRGSAGFARHEPGAGKEPPPIGGIVADGAQTVKGEDDEHIAGVSGRQDHSPQAQSGARLDTARLALLDRRQGPLVPTGPAVAVWRVGAVRQSAGGRRSRLRVSHLRPPAEGQRRRLMLAWHFLSAELERRLLELAPMEEM